MESIFYPAAHFILGSWYKREIAARQLRRHHAADIVFVSLGIGKTSCHLPRIERIGEHVQRISAGRRLQRLGRRAWPSGLEMALCDG